jgi:hypothetical protein
MTDRRKKGRGSERRNLLRQTDRLTTREETRERLTVKLSATVIDRLRNAVYWTPGATIAGVVEQCLAHSIDAMERKRGAQFPVREEDLRPGRPKKTSG